MPDYILIFPVRQTTNNYYKTFFPIAFIISISFCSRVVGCPSHGVDLRIRRGGHWGTRSNVKFQTILQHIDSDLIARGVHLRPMSTVGCACCVPEFHVRACWCRRNQGCNPSFSPRFQLHDGRWSCVKNWNTPVTMWVRQANPPPSPGNDETRQIAP